MSRNNYRNYCNEEQTHVHEFEGSVIIVEEDGDFHNHRFAGITGEVIPLPGNHHAHRISTTTDFYEDHFHDICVQTGQEIVTGDRHVHFVKAKTQVQDGHAHPFRVATLINDPIGE